MTQLPVPSHFDPNSVDSIWRVRYAGRAAEAKAWARQHGIRPASGDERRIGLLLVDCQNTFCIPGHELFVAGRSGRGAVDDSERLCAFIYRNLGVFTEIAVTLDTHVALQIFHPIFWLDENGDHPDGGVTVISVDDVETGRWRVNPEVANAVADGDVGWLRTYALHYVHSLARSRYPLMVWPYHAMLGGIGHALVSAVEEAVFFHGVARCAATRIEVKGNNPLTENYSVLSPEVLLGPGGYPVAHKNDAFIHHLLTFDALVVAGQAKSHCVAWTISDLLTELRTHDPALAGRVYLLEDCTSPVVVPDVVDFTDQANEAFERFAKAGMHRVRSTELPSTWDAFPS